MKKFLIENGFTVGELENEFINANLKVIIWRHNEATIFKLDSKKFKYSNSITVNSIRQLRKYVK